MTLETRGLEGLLGGPERREGEYILKVRPGEEKYILMVRS